MQCQNKAVQLLEYYYNSSWMRFMTCRSFFVYARQLLLAFDHDRSSSSICNVNLAQSVALRSHFAALSALDKHFYGG
ncbi:hypothetical protein BDV97DRAFT_234905 [Delphinella strobiligena]|nr:hypothetical protein BDV97DRAFT_234905 [Delphinella strobiligena]